MIYNSSKWLNSFCLDCIKITEEAPSEIDEEFAAVTVPFFLKTGFKVGIFVISDLKVVHLINNNFIFPISL